MNVLIVISAAALLLSAAADMRKTIVGLKRGLKLFAGLLPAVLAVVMLVCIALYLVPKETILRHMGAGSGIVGFALAALIGSISLIPGIIAYPLAGSLIRSGVSYAVIAVFITTLTMVGIITMPVEARYFGLKTALLRNALSFIGAVIIGAVISLLWNIL